MPKRAENDNFKTMIFGLFFPSMFLQHKNFAQFKIKLTFPEYSFEQIKSLLPVCGAIKSPKIFKVKKRIRNYFPTFSRKNIENNNIKEKKTLKIQKIKKNA